MLLNLTILDLAVVKSLNLDLAQGMSVLTGETGAGKSILLTALGLALGDRAESGIRFKRRAPSASMVTGA